MAAKARKAATKARPKTKAAAKAKPKTKAAAKAKPKTKAAASPKPRNIVERVGRVTRDGRTNARTLRRMTVYMPPELANQLELRALSSGKNKSTLITQAVAAFLAV